LIRIKTKTLLFTALVLVVLAYPAKLAVQVLVKKTVQAELTKYIQENYQTETQLEIDKLRISFVDLLRLKIIASAQNLTLNETAKIPTVNLSIALFPLLFHNQLLVNHISIENPELNYNHDFSFAISKSDKGKSRSLFLNKVLIKNTSINLENNLTNQNFILNNLDLELKNLIIAAKNDKPATYSIKNKTLNLSGTLRFDSKTNYGYYSSKGQITDLDFGQLLTVISGKKQGLSGLLKIDNLKLTSFGNGQEDLSQNLVVTGDLSVKDGSLYLLDYIIKTKKVVNSVIPIGKLIDVFEVVTFDQIKGMNGTRYNDSLVSDDSKFSSLTAKLEIKDKKIILNNLKIRTPIMKIQGSGYNSFDQKMSYKLEASLANIPLLPIIIKGVKKVPIVLIDLHGYSYRRTKSLLKLLSRQKEKDSEPVKN
jgi:hypothetical protein